MRGRFEQSIAQELHNMLDCKILRDAEAIRIVCSAPNWGVQYGNISQYMATNGAAKHKN